MKVKMCNWVQGLNIRSEVGLRRSVAHYNNNVLVSGTSKHSSDGHKHKQLGDHEIGVVRFAPVLFEGETESEVTHKVAHNPWLHMKQLFSFPVSPPRCHSVAAVL